MKLLKQILFFFIGLVMVLLVFLLFAKKNYVFEKSISVNSQSSEVFNFLKFLKNQEKFNHWYSQDSNVTYAFSGEDGTTSAKFEWKSNSCKLRSGFQDIQTMSYPENIQIGIKTSEPYNIKGNMEFVLKDKNNKTDLTWKINVRFPFPYNIVILSDDFDKSLSESMEISLNNIKKELEK